MLLMNNWAIDWITDDNNPPITLKDLKVFEKANNYDQKYFGDMIFAKDSISYLFLKMDKNDEEFNKRNLPDIFTEYDSSFYGCKYEKMDDKYDGAFQHSNRTIYLSDNISDEKTEDIVLLHELIHLHEWILQEEKVPLYFRDIIFMSLYQDLKNKIKDLDKRISDLSYLYSLSSIQAFGGEHDLLFFLKSFDLDIKQGYELGTVFSYKY